MNRIGFRTFHRWVAPTLKVLKAKRDSLPVKPPDPRNSYIEWNYEAELYAFGKRLHENFDSNLLRRALMDQSYIAKHYSELKKVDMEVDQELVDNKTLSVEGDQLIDKCIYQYVSHYLPKLPEKYFDSIKSYLKSQEVMAHVSSNIGLNDIIMGDSYPLDKDILVNGFKAVVAALLNSSGERQAKLFIRDLLVSQLCGTDLTKIVTPSDPMTELVEELKSRGYQSPESRLLGQAAINTLLPVFRVGIYSDRKLLGKGFGESPEIAEEMAACDALWTFWGIKLNMKPFPIQNEC